LEGKRSEGKEGEENDIDGRGTNYARTREVKRQQTFLTGEDPKGEEEGEKSATTRLGKKKKKKRSQFWGEREGKEVFGGRKEKECLCLAVGKRGVFVFTRGRKSVNGKGTGLVENMGGAGYTLVCFTKEHRRRKGGA